VPPTGSIPPNRHQQRRRAIANRNRDAMTADFNLIANGADSSDPQNPA
jgi:hypothetical protein